MSCVEPSLNKGHLLAAIDQIDQIDNSSWLGSLNERKLAELEFHNRDRNQDFVSTAAKDQDTYERFYGNKKYYLATYRSKRYIEDWIRQNASRRIFLDYACGNGQYALLAAQAGAELSLGFDISDVSVRNCRIAARKAGLGEVTRFFQADAENTKLPDNCVDAILCSGMLHHLDLSYALPELRRILRPGGCILAVEALDYNPLIKLYRLLTPDMRTEWEKAHILTLADVEFASRFLEVGEIRYWHVVGYLGGKFPALLAPLDAVDKLLERIPLVNRLAWMMTFTLYKRED